jgi:hypothetical protein
MPRKSENLQPNLFDEAPPEVNTSPALRVELAGLVAAMLQEIAAALANVRSGGGKHEQDHG